MTECIYQGSFNPIHNAHLAAAEYAHKKLNFERIVFIPAFKPPHKDLTCFGSENALHRLEMLQLAVQNISYFDVSAIEYMRSTPSYTYDTIIQLYDIIKPQEKISFIIGSDAFRQIESWYRSDELKQLIDFVLFVRENDFDAAPFEQLREKGYNYTLMDMPFMDISSETVRKRCAEGLPIDDLVPKETAGYIKQHALYEIQR